MTHRLADILNRVGLFLGFVSFWFAAPEFIGEPRLKAWEHALAAGLLRMPKALKRMLWGMTAVALSFYVRTVVTNVIAHRPFQLPDVPQSWPLAFAVVSSLLLLAQIFVEPLVSKLANDDRVRQRALFLAAVLFTVSFVLQFAATYQKPDGR